MKTIKILLQILIILFSYTNLAYAKIIKAYSVNDKQVQNLLNAVDENTLVLIEIDETLITPSSNMFRYNGNMYYTFINDLANQAKQIPALNQAIITWLSDRKIMLVEDQWPILIQKMQNVGALVFGLNYMNKHVTTLIGNLGNWRNDELTNIGIHFTDQLYSQKSFIINEINIPKHVNSFFYKGVLFTGSFEKAKTILDFINLTKIQPKKVIVFDHNLKTLKKIQSVLRVLDTQYYGVEYLQVFQIPGKTDVDIVKFQQNALINYGKWFEDSKVQELMQLNKLND